MLGPYNWQGEMTISHRSKPATTEPVEFIGKTWDQANAAVDELVAGRLKLRGVRQVSVSIRATAPGILLNVGKIQVERRKDTGEMSSEPKSEMARLRKENAALRHAATDFHWMGRLPADGQGSVAASLLNAHVQTLLSLGVSLNPTVDETSWA